MLRNLGFIKFGRKSKQVIPNSFLHLAKTDFAFDKKQPFILVSMCYFIILHTEYNNALWI